MTMAIGVGTVEYSSRNVSAMSVTAVANVSHVNVPREVITALRLGAANARAKIAAVIEGSSEVDVSPLICVACPWVV